MTEASDTYQAGYDAGLAGGPKTDNPHTTEPQRGWWLSGWEHGALHAGPDHRRGA